MTSTEPQPSEQASDLAESIAARVEGSSLRIAVAESLTGGQLSMRLAAAPDSSSWFAGGVVAYMTETKHRVLSVSPGPVVSARAAEEMAAGVARLTGANLTLSVTGVGGPDEQDGREVGTVFIGIRSPHGELYVAERMLGGSPEEIVESAVVASLRLLDARVEALVSTHTERRRASADSRGSCRVSHGLKAHGVASTARSRASGSTHSHSDTSSGRGFTVPLMVAR